jgi:hypothetical protein
MHWYFFEYKAGLDLEASYIFDTGEPFEPIIKARWERELESYEFTGRYNKWVHIKSIGTSPMRATVGIQVADMLAWAHNREKNVFVTDYTSLALALRVLAPSKIGIIDEEFMRSKYARLIHKPYDKY